MLLLVSGCGGSASGQTSSQGGRRTIRYTVPDPGMEPTLKSGSRLTIELQRVTPHIGEIIAFHPPTSASPTKLSCVNIDQGPGQPNRQPCGVRAPHESSMIFVERVVGVPGDRIAVVGGHVVRNGVKQKEPYTESCGGVAECYLPKAIVVPSGDYFVMGDNRGQANDSRFWGPLPGSWVIGTVRP